MAVSKVDKKAVRWVVQSADLTVAYSVACLVEMMAVVMAARSVVTMAVQSETSWAAWKAGCWAGLWVPMSVLR